jgi:hypothetical protein
MSTRSIIVIEKEGGKYFGIPCHWDGYLSNNGALLLDHYSNREKLEQLMSHGELSILKPEIEPNPAKEHSFDNPQENVCVYYGRDRGEIDYQKAKEFTIKELDESYWKDYIYIYGLDGQWKYFAVGRLDEGLKSVKKDLDQMFTNWGLERPKDVYGFYTKETIEMIMKLNKK